MIDIQNLTAASFMPGLQNVGQIKGQSLVNGTLEASPGYPTNTSNLTGVILLELPEPSVVSVLRVNLPSANGQLATKWFPLFGTVELNDLTAQWLLIMSVGSANGGRNIYFNFVNESASPVTFTNFPINIYGHLYTYPW